MRLLAITDLSLMGPAPLARLEALAAILGPELAVLIREPGLSISALYALARESKAILEQSGAQLFVADRLDLARALEIGVQLPERGIPVTDARRWLGPAALIGASRHDAEGVAAALRAGASFATLSPIFDSPGKGPALGLNPLREARARAPAGGRVVALGGVDASNAAAILSAGADAVAAIRAAWAEDFALARALLPSR